jgi:hypothetical protein
VVSNFNAMRLTVAVGWAIYPRGFVIGSLCNSTNPVGNLYVVYNIADRVNRIGFVLSVWSAILIELFVLSNAQCGLFVAYSPSLQPWMMTPSCCKVAPMRAQMFFF